MERFNLNANTIEEAKIYLKKRYKQLMHAGVSLVHENTFILEEKTVCYNIFKYCGHHYVAFYILQKDRGNGFYSKVYNHFTQYEDYKMPVLTSSDCELESYLRHKQIPHIVVDGLTQTREYKLMQSIYAGDCAKRSNIEFMNHIDEGLYILYKINARKLAKLAYILHPIFQSDIDLENNITLNEVNYLNPKALILAIEYRNVANEYLSHRLIKNISEIRLSPLESVNKMLIADKIQNKKDFEIAHLNTHPRSKELQIYFNNWLEKLNITEEEYKNFVKELL